MRILSINTFFPHPPRRGMDVIYLNLLKAQAEKHDVTMVTLARTGHEIRALSALEDICTKIHVVAPPSQGSKLKRGAYWGFYNLRSSIAWRPVPTFYDAPPAMTQLIRKLTSTELFDIVELHHSTCGKLVDHIMSGVKVLYMYDAHFRSCRRRAETHKGFEKFADLAEASKYRKFETALVKKFDGVLFGQDADLLALQGEFAEGAVSDLMPNMIDTTEIAPTGHPVQPKNAVFVGAMSHRANVDAALDFASRSWPRVRACIPDAEFWIVGAGPPAEVSDLHGKNGISVFADVPDIKPYVASAAVYVAPLRIGSGVKVKIIEALAMGKAIAATPIAAEGMGLVDGQDIRIGEAGDALGDLVITLLERDDLRTGLEREARASALRLFSLEKGRSEIDDIYARLVGAAGGTTSPAAARAV